MWFFLEHIACKLPRKLHVKGKVMLQSHPFLQGARSLKAQMVGYGRPQGFAARSVCVAAWNGLLAAHPGRGWWPEKESLG